MFGLVRKREGVSRKPLLHPLPRRLLCPRAHLSNHNALLPPSASAWVRRTLAESIRSRNPYAVNLLLGGYDTTTDLPHLYWLDYLGTKATLQYGAHGAGMYVALSLMDKWWYEGMDKKAGVDLLNRCIDEVQNREFHVVIVPDFIASSALESHAVSRVGEDFITLALLSRRSCPRRRRRMNDLNLVLTCRNGDQV